MAAEAPSSVGIVTPRSFVHEAPFQLVSGDELPGFELVYETYGELNAARSNAVLICHALSGDHHAAGFHSADDSKPGWWDACIGPGKPIDTNHFFVVCPNNLGGCAGSTGPISVNPGTGEVWGETFPTVTVRDWVRSQALLADHLGIDRWAVVAGGSLGGMQALQWSIDEPERVANVAAIASAPWLSAQNIAFNEIARQSILSDPEYRSGRYLDAGVIPERGLKLARMVGHVTYQSDDGLRDRFGREVKSGDLDAGKVQFQVESYLHYQGGNFSRRFDANTYVLMTRALDLFDPAREHDGDLVRTFSRATARFMLASFTTDWRFSPGRSREIVNALIAANRDVTYAEIDAAQGHDAFLLPVPRYIEVFGAYMQRVALELQEDHTDAS